ncbi:1-deoxy-D-xylulose 5-phosphate reductoisomerase [Streptomyces hirsutus]
MSGPEATASPLTAPDAVQVDVALLAEQAHRLRVRTVAVAREDVVGALRDALAARYGPGEPLPEILAGADAATRLAASDCHTVLNGITGSIGLAPTLAALEAGRTLALANKESLIVGGPLVKALAKPDRSSRSTPSTPRCSRRWPPEPARTSGSSSSPRPAAPSAAVPGTNWRTSPSRTPWPTPPGPWAR